MIDYKNNYINPTLVVFIQSEQKFYKMISKLFKKLGRLDIEFNDLDKKREVPAVEYDPFKYIRGINLLDMNNLSVLKEIKSLKFLQPEKLKIQNEKEILPIYINNNIRLSQEYMIRNKEEELSSEVFMTKSALAPRYHSPKPHAEKKSPELTSKKRYIV